MSPLWTTGEGAGGCWRSRRRRRGKGRQDVEGTDSHGDEDAPWRRGWPRAGPIATAHSGEACSSATLHYLQSRPFPVFLRLFLLSSHPSSLSPPSCALHRPRPAAIIARSSPAPCPTAATARPRPLSSCPTATAGPPGLSPPVFPVSTLTNRPFRFIPSVARARHPRRSPSIPPSAHRAYPYF